MSTERQLTSAPHGHILTNTGVWSADGQWIVYDTRSDPAGTVFDGSRIERVHVESGRVEVLYESRHGAHCGVVTCHPRDARIVFIHGPEHPTPDWQYSACHRRGAMVDANLPGAITNLDACDLTPPFTPGALRGGSHVHVWSPDGAWVSFTYEDHVLAALDAANPLGGHDRNQRNIGISVADRAVMVPRSHSRNHDGSHFSVLVTRTVNQPYPASGEIGRASEEAWVGDNGYVKSDGSRQRRAIAFQGEVVTARGETIREVFIANLPDDLTQPGRDPLLGTATRRPAPPQGVKQQRLTFTAERKYPGIQGVRHWLRSSPDGGRIAFLMRDDAGVAQLWTVSPRNGELVQLTRNPHDIASAFTWDHEGSRIAHVTDGSVCVTDTRTGEAMRLTPRREGDDAPRPEACVFSPDGRSIAYVRTVRSGAERWNQVFVVNV